MTRFYLILTFCFFTVPFFGQETDDSLSSSNLESATDMKEDVASNIRELDATDSIHGLSELAVLNAIDTIKIDTTLIEGRVVALIDHAEATDFDKKWLESWRNNVIDSSLIIKPEDTAGKVVIENFTTEQLKERIAYLDSQTPFNFEYNPSLEKIIKHYLKNRQETLANLMGKAKYYFPMFEEHLAKYNIPMELKYLAIVESALRANATSRVGAKGLWQFMYGTGREYDLKVSSYVDERCDPIKATEAACKYLTKLHGIFNDWDLALAAYNSGPGNVNKAIRRSGGQKNYWNIRHYLPRETAGYLPAFYATYYIFEYAEEHQLYAKNEVLHTFETDTVVVKRQITFDQVNKVLGTDMELLTFLNPQYKLKIIPVIKDRDYTLTLPKFATGSFVSNEAEIYAYAEQEDAKREKPLPKYFEANDRIRYRVRSGDYLGKIANRYGVSVSSIKRWNGLKSDNLRVGQRLTIYPRRPVASVNTTSSTKKVSSQKTPPKGEYSTYVVQKGDSLWLISQKYPKVSVAQLKEWNNIWSSKSLKPGTKLKIY
ncbi:LysM peptidoglycan-binding domain-containing protein [Lutimonas saemankumensis]|uniref:lytic transglycosylase domain-containing protein n=1 Tax=Lutimonas saemankumensis TaxID=483016 RepID=UPI001CD5CAB2|nr:lytic transglycosylase domain-containing protein [Lutimonas saemankumensis]MCA0933462.1 LysM peptidoglycan-binding domain-containing protein [Lutimonas saemankumensis]